MSAGNDAAAGVLNVPVLVQDVGAMAVERMATASLVILTGRADTQGPSPDGLDSAGAVGREGVHLRRLLAPRLATQHRFEVDGEHSTAYSCST